MHLYTIIAAPFVAQLLHVASASDPLVKEKSSWIQAAFLIGWALGGGFFGRIGDRLGRSRALSLTILTYALFTGLSFLAQTWWQLLIFRFIAALGIGGEWAVGSSLLSETWPKRWRPGRGGANRRQHRRWRLTILLATYPQRGVCLGRLFTERLTIFDLRDILAVAWWVSCSGINSIPQPPELSLARSEQLISRSFFIVTSQSSGIFWPGGAPFRLHRPFRSCAWVSCSGRHIVPRS